MAENLNKLLENAQPVVDGAKRQPLGNGNSAGKGLTNKGMKSGTSMNNGMSDQDYLGYGFDAAVRKGVDAARNALRQRISNLDAGKQQALMARFESEIASQKSLRKDTGLGAGMEKSYRDAAKTKTPLSLDYATRARNAEVVKKLPSTIGNAVVKAIKSDTRDSWGYRGEMGF